MINIMKKLSLKDFYYENKENFAITLVTNESTLNGSDITIPYINRPGLALSGYLERFPYNRIQVMGETEITYLQSIPESELFERMKLILKNSIPCFVVTKGLTVPQQMEYLANDLKIAIFSSRLTTDQLIQKMDRYLRNIFAPTEDLHGTLVDVYGVGVIITGKSGIGKSECALDLVERGHRLIADDMVKMTNLDDTLIGSAVSNIGYFMEIRGVGIIDIEKMFGIEAVRRQKRIEIQVELVHWKDNAEYERIGLDTRFARHLGCQIPIIYLPISPGKNVSVIIEVIAMNLILKTYGYNSADVFTSKMQEAIMKKRRAKKILFEEKE